MDATRSRLGSLLEWLAAAICILGILAVGAVVVRDFRTVTAAVTPVIAHEEAAPDPPASIPSRSVSVPVLLLPDGAELHVGDTVGELSERVGPGAEVAPAAAERTASGERVTRFYARDGQRFAVVLQKLAGDPQMRIAAIYLPSSR